MKGNFFAMLSRMKYIFRWGLMKNSSQENLSEHTTDVVMVSHALAVIRNKRFAYKGKVDVQQVVLTALYHDCSEILTGDLPTPVKYHNPEIRDAYKQVEAVANRKLLSMLDDDMRPEFEPYFFQKDPEVLKLVKAADKISALIKCIEEKKMGNHEFSKASLSLRESILDMQLPEAEMFVTEFLPAYNLTLDELH